MTGQEEKTESVALQVADTGDNSAFAHMLDSVTPDEMERAALRAAGFVEGKVDRGTIIVVMKLAQLYGLDLMLKHMVPIQGRPYVTRDGLLHVAHKSQVFNGIELSEMPTVVPTSDQLPEHWLAWVTVYRHDMSHGFCYFGRYPTQAQNSNHGPEMAVTRAECHALRRAFDVAIPSVEEQWTIAADGRILEETTAGAAELNEALGLTEDSETPLEVNTITNNGESVCEDKAPSEESATDVVANDPREFALLEAPPDISTWSDNETRKWMGGVSGEADVVANFLELFPLSGKGVGPKKRQDVADRWHTLCWRNQDGAEDMFKAYRS